MAYTLVVDKEIQIAKIVANATASSWSQAYNAGKLFAVISLTSEEQKEENFLNLLGKEVLDNLEAEYFALETKDLESIKIAVKTSLEKISANIKTSLVVGTIVNDILYVFAKNGKADLKRGDTFGKVLEAGGQLEVSSGFLEENDLIFLQTSQFSDAVSSETLASSIDSYSISQIAENLAPTIHEKEGTGASAIILEYHKPLGEQAVASAQEQEPGVIGESEQESVPLDSKRQSLESIKKYFFFALEKSQSLKLGSVDRSRKTILTVTVILLLVLVGSIFFAVKKQGDEKTRALVAQYYEPALKKFDEGQSLLDLNQSLARDSFISSQKLLLEGQPKFSRGSSEKNKVDELLKKVNESLEKTANINNVTPTEASTSESKMLANALKDTGSSFWTKEDNDIYSLDSSGVLKNGKSIIKRSWASAGGLGVYFGNIYVLDKTAKQIYKFVSTSKEYVKTNYFKNSSPDLSSASSIAIDGSIWVLGKDGSVLKFTRGVSDNLSLTGLDKAFSSPTRIFTNTATENVYILDNGNSRIVVFDKNGAYKEQYQSALFKDAREIEVSKDKAFVLVGSKLYSFNL